MFNNVSVGITWISMDFYSNRSQGCETRNAFFNLLRVVKTMTLFRVNFFVGRWFESLSFPVPIHVSVKRYIKSSLNRVYKSSIYCNFVSISILCYRIAAHTAKNNVERISPILVWIVCFMQKKRKENLSPLNPHPHPRIYFHNLRCMHFVKLFNQRYNIPAHSHHNGIYKVTSLMGARSIYKNFINSKLVEFN